MRSPEPPEPDNCQDTEPSSATIIADWSASGLSKTSTETVTSEVPPLPSDTVTSNEAAPWKFASGVNVTSPLPSSTAVPLTALTMALIDSTSPSASESFANNVEARIVVCSSSLTVITSATVTGVSLTAAMSTVTTEAARPPLPSETVTSNVPVPLASVSGVNRTSPFTSNTAVPLAALPTQTISN